MKASFVRSYSDPSEMPTVGAAQVVFLGRSNAGKSSLINSLTKTPDLAHASSSPGRTKLLNVFDVDGRFHLVDVPGYGFAKGSKTDRAQLFQLIHGYLNISALLKLAVVIVDSRIGPTEDDIGMMEYLHEANIPFVIVANKVDKLSKTELAKSLADIRTRFSEAPVIPHSLVTGVGRGELYDLILQRISS
jgi:GTP-binding protein